MPCWDCHISLGDKKKNTISLYDITSRRFPEQLSSAESWTTDVTVWIRRSGASAWTMLVAQQADVSAPSLFSLLWQRYWP